MADGVCLTCGYDGKNTNPTPPTTTPDPTETTPDATETTEAPPRDNQKMSGRIWIPAVVGGTATAGAAAAATIILRRRRA